MHKSIIRYLLTAFTLLTCFAVQAQKDSLILVNGNTIVGEIKMMNKGVLQIETPYSDSDFKIEIEGIKELYSNARFMFTTTNGSRYTGSFGTNEQGLIIIRDDQKGEVVTTLQDIVFINSLDDGFLSRLYASVDLGYSLTKANNQQQFNLNFRMGYLADLWSLDGYYNSLISTQTDVEKIQRNDGGASYRYFLPKDWYLSADITFLSNTEQDLELRTNGKLGLGKYLIHTNQAYWGFNGGLSYNNEDFKLTASDASDSLYGRKSFEGFLRTEVNLYDIGDLNLFTNITAYPSFTEQGRWRADFRFDAKYDDFLIDDFYIRAGFTLNYDNQPAAVGKEVDYIFTTGFGWEL